MASVIFLHGLNTYGDDDIHIGPWKFAPMHAAWQRALESRGLQFHAVTDLGAREPHDQAARALDVLQRLGPTPPFHFLGQSTGGLTARALAAHPKMQGRVASLITIGTPHAGALAAELGLEFNRRHPLLNRLFALFGYDTGKKAAIYEHFTPTAVREFQLTCPLPSGVRAYSLICEVEPSGLSWPLRILHSKINPEGLPGDGFIASQSQRFGECLGPFRLDHFGELGFFPFARRTQRQKSALEFERLADTVTQIIGNRGPWASP